MGKGHIIIYIGRISRLWLGCDRQELAKRKPCHSNHPSDHTSKVNLASKTAESCRWVGERYHFKDLLKDLVQEKNPPSLRMVVGGCKVKMMQSIFKSHANHIQQHLSHIKVAHLQLSSREFDMVPQYTIHGSKGAGSTTSQGVAVFCWIHDRNIIVSALLSSRYVSNQKTCLSKIHQKIWKTDDSVATAETMCRDFE